MARHAREPFIALQFDLFDGPAVIVIDPGGSVSSAGTPKRKRRKRKRRHTTCADDRQLNLFTQAERTRR
jgi:hypothetical protein